MSGKETREMRSLVILTTMLNLLTRSTSSDFESRPQFVEHDLGVLLLHQKQWRIHILVVLVRASCVTVEWRNHEPLTPRMRRTPYIGLDRQTHTLDTTVSERSVNPNCVSKSFKVHDSIMSLFTLRVKRVFTTSFFLDNVKPRSPMLNRLHSQKSKTRSGPGCQDGSLQQVTCSDNTRKT